MSLPGLTRQSRSMPRSLSDRDRRDKAGRSTSRLGEAGHASSSSRSFRPELWFGRVEGCAGRDGSILIYRREPIGAPRAVFCANAGARLCPAAIGRVTEPVTALLARAACSPCGARTRACVPRRGTGPIPRHDASRFAPLGWTGRAHASSLGLNVKDFFQKASEKPRQLRFDQRFRNSRFTQLARSPVASVRRIVSMPLTRKSRIELGL